MFRITHDIGLAAGIQTFAANQAPLGRDHIATTMDRIHEANRQKFSDAVKTWAAYAHLAIEHAKKEEVKAGSSWTENVFWTASCLMTGLEGWEMRGDRDDPSKIRKLYAELLAGSISSCVDANSKTFHEAAIKRLAQHMSTHHDPKMFEGVWRQELSDKRRDPKRLRKEVQIMQEAGLDDLARLLLQSWWRSEDIDLQARLLSMVGSAGGAPILDWCARHLHDELRRQHQLHSIWHSFAQVHLSRVPEYRYGDFDSYDPSERVLTVRRLYGAGASGLDHDVAWYEEAAKGWENPHPEIGLTIRIQVEDGETRDVVIKEPAIDLRDF